MKWVAELGNNGSVCVRGGSVPYGEEATLFSRLLLLRPASFGVKSQAGNEGLISDEMDN
jgi:hypothetical protein